jgi:hypothetical protein
MSGRSIGLGVGGIVIALMAVVSCSSITGPGERTVGIIGAEQAAALGSVSPAISPAGTDPGDPLELPVLEAPDTVPAGITFDVVVRTLGPDGCWRADGADVSSAPSDVEIIPYDRITGQNCTDAVRRLARTVTVRFDEAGDATIRVTGRIVFSTDGIWDERIGTIEHRVVVR